MSGGWLPARALIAGTVAALVGFGSTFAIVIQGLAVAGATPSQITSGLTGMLLGVGAVGAGVALVYRAPVGIAWSLPAAALLLSTGPLPDGFGATVGAFIMAGLLIVLAGLWRPLGGLITRIPPSIANAMLAGILLRLCFAPFAALETDLWPALVLLTVYVLAYRFARIMAVPAAVIAAFLLIAVGSANGEGFALVPPRLEWVAPVFTWDALVGLAIPVFIVTMASQNIPGIAILSIYGYRPPAGPLFRTTGAGTMLVAPFGVIPMNLAAITAAMIASPDAEPQPERRYIAAVAAGVVYMLLALTAGMAVAAVTNAPPVLIQAVAGLALLGPLGASLVNGLKEEAERPAAIMTLLVAASGITLAGVGSVFWGLLAGLAVHALQRSERRA